jgi:hypothetical protein
MRQLYLNILGNITAGFKPEGELRDLEQKRGGYKEMSVYDIFDFEAYQTELKKEPNSFMEAFKDKQMFIEFVTEVYRAEREHELQKSPSGIKSEVAHF